MLETPWSQNALVQVKILSPEYYFAPASLACYLPPSKIWLLFKQKRRFSILFYLLVRYAMGVIVYVATLAIGGDR